MEGWLERQREKDKAAGMQQARQSRNIAEWLWGLMARQPPDGQPEAVSIPDELHPTKAVLKPTKAARREGRRLLYRGFFRLMRRDPDRTVRNVARDLFELVGRCAGGRVFVTADQVVFHLHVKVPRDKNVIVLDATANAELLRPIFAPRPVEVVCDERVRPKGRVIQLMDFNGPRSYLNKLPRKAVRILDAIGDLHPDGTVVVISHKSCVDRLAQASRHRNRIRTVYFGALRGRNDLEPGPGRHIACHVVIGSPKTTEEDRRQLALAVYGDSILPFADLVTLKKGVVGHVPQELAEAEGQRQLWEVRIKGYADPRMQAIYNATVTAELTQAADRARVLIHEDAVVYLLTNEPCPRLWFAEMCLAEDYLNLGPGVRKDYEKNYRAYEGKARKLLDAGRTIGNADVCRAMVRKPGWGNRYWRRFMAANRDALDGERKVRWKEL